LANLAAGWLVVADPQGRLVGYPRVGLVAVTCFGLTFALAARLRAVAPHASKPADPELMVVAAVD